MQASLLATVQESVAGGHLQKGVHLVEADTELPPFFDTFEDFKEFCCEYRANLGRIVRLCACLLPEPALLSAHRRLSNALQICSTSGAAPQVPPCSAHSHDMPSACPSHHSCRQAKDIANAADE